MKMKVWAVLGLMMLMLSGGSTVFAQEVLAPATLTEDDPQAERESGQILDGFYDEATAEDTEDSYGISFFSLPTGYTHNPKYASYNILNGIDVSYYQGDINWNAVKADGIDFAIIRVGYRGYGAEGNLREDPKYAQNIQGALNAGLKVGVYIFSQATTTAEAIAEADFVLSRIKGYNITFPVVMDFEYASVSGGEGGRLYNANLSRRAATDVCKAFAERVKSAGYIPMIYANKSMLQKDLYASELSANYDIWLANYTYQTSYDGDYTCWQYTSDGTVSGISGRVDMNFWYESSTVYQGVDYSAVYDFNYYMSANSDLLAGYGNDKKGALAHFVNHGMAEGRQANEEFNVRTYRNRYADLRRGYGTNWKNYYLHYINHGKAEGRSGAGTAVLVPITTYNGVDYSAVYNYNFYISKYPGLSSAYGGDDYQLLQHFVEHGMSEGRQGSEEFDVLVYKNRYLDLRRSYKNDLKGYYLHYLYHGKAEGRSGSGEAQFVGETIYNGVDYAAVYDYNFYVSKYPDLKNGFNGDENALLQHFVENGMAEGRQGSAEFDVQAYMSRYEDLHAGYGNDLKGYYLHYLQVGKAEGRNGAPFSEAEFAGVYDFATYMAMNPDLSKVYGSDEAAALKHFAMHGMAEGRQASDEFNVHAYRNRYADLKAGYGNDLRGYYLHYVNSGKAEGRNGRVEEATGLALDAVLELETGLELEPVVQPETEPEVEAAPEVNPETEVETVPEVDTEIETELELEPEVNLETEVGSESETEADTEEKTEAQTGNEAQTGAEVETEVETESEVEAEADAEVQTEAENNVEADANTEEKTEVETGSEAEMTREVDVEVKAESEAEAENILSE